MANDTFKTALC